MPDELTCLSIMPALVLGGAEERLVEQALDYAMADITQRMHGAATLGDYDLARSGAKAVISYKSTLLSVTIASMGMSWGCG